MAIVESYTSGNCKIYIHDDSIVKTKEEEIRILQNLAEIYRRIQVEKILREQSES